MWPFKCLVSQNKELCFIKAAQNRIIYKKVKFGDYYVQQQVWLSKRFFYKKYDYKEHEAEIRQKLRNISETQVGLDLNENLKKLSYK